LRKWYDLLLLGERMKKKIALLILIMCAAAGFTQEIVGTVVLKGPNITIEYDFYDNNIVVEEITEIIKKCILSTNSKRLMSVSDEEIALLNEEIEKLCEDVDYSGLDLDWFLKSQFFAIKFNFNYHGKDYFVLGIMPEGF
jgi:hypothetical protein